MAGEEEERITSISDLASKVDQLFEMIKGGGGGKPAEKAEAPGSLDEQISAAVAKAAGQEKARTDAEREKAELHDRVKKLEEAREVKPVSLSRLTKVFWGGGGDE